MGKRHFILATGTFFQILFIMYILNSLSHLVNDNVGVLVGGRGLGWDGRHEAAVWHAPHAAVPAVTVTQLLQGGKIRIWDKGLVWICFTGDLTDRKTGILMFIFWSWQLKKCFNSQRNLDLLNWNQYINIYDNFVLLGFTSIHNASKSMTLAKDVRVNWMGADLVAKRRVNECDVCQCQQDLVWTPNQSNLNDTSPI